MSIKRKLAAMEEETGKTFLSYSNPKAIIEEYNKVSKWKKQAFISTFPFVK